MQELESLKDIIALPKKIVITTHHKPDADALGSSLGMANYLIKKGHEVDVITPSDYPSFLHWMKGNKKVINFEDLSKQEKAIKKIESADVIICLDFSCLSRLNSMQSYVNNATAYKVNIDHHQDPKNFSDFNYWSTSAAATCELVYDLIVKIGDHDLIDKDIAECLYAGIMTDTGGFKHPNTTKNVHLVTAELIGLGADNTKISKLIYDTNSIDKLKFLGFAITRRLTILENLHTAYFSITKKDLKKYNSQTGDTEGLVNYALSLEGIKIAALFTERDDAVKISFRSTHDVAINKFAAAFFDGGGHKNASGGKSEMGLKETTDRFEKLIKKNKKALLNQLELVHENN
ncbi:exopolyphosphatase [Rhodonellum psychrophilum GCM71 = DSM 17998]|uniref:Exopolyphosphatase n=2 Tax=Rhodonellum TaxID=336827 RepID=U5C2P4_9BACT|nr:MULTISPECIES: bifunctional oligoribonuclease/PAP phosphatase NrnA [Rhodonellum]ERM84079.1 exopolyphosphatase [Rhodonellum psychrophilum GCM71 = DSM 17998]MDO9552699.1 bifunctional oligoribonuclease/PAP phosphatase NrnA [Rhodonellum sp.]SDY41360.1 phosphoesterase RecJ domain-containing protein [Rhodonellum ikkaensis]